MNFVLRQKSPVCRKQAFLCLLVRQAGFEPTTLWFVARYSIQLSYCRSVRIRILSGIPSDVKSPKEKYREEGMRGEPRAPVVKDRPPRGLQCKALGKNARTSRGLEGVGLL